MSFVQKKTSYLFIIEVIAAMFLTIAVIVVGGNRNYGLEGDEVFSILSSTSMGGFKEICFLNDQTWYEAAYFENAVTATGTERFNLKMVVENQAMDSHPPLYYIFLNLICSVWSGQFSKWFGIGLNTFFLLFLGGGLFLLFRYFKVNKHFALILSMIFCCSEMAVSQTLFIRMYVLLAVMFVFQSLYHLYFYDAVLAAPNYSLTKYWKKYVVLVILTIVGGLTHYYFLVWQVLISAFLVLGLWRHKRGHDILRYTGVMAVSAVLYIGIYPASLMHIFIKYRGRDAVYKFLKVGSFFDTTLGMFEGTNKSLFKGMMLPLVIILLLLLIILMRLKKIKPQSLRRGMVLLLPAIIYFIGIAKASPFVAIRYIFPITPFIFAGILLLALRLVMCIKAGRIRAAGLGGVLLVAFFLSFYFQNVPIKATFFAERKEIVDALAKEIDYCVYVTGDEYNWKMWEDYINYPVFKGLFFIDGQNQQPIIDEKLLSQDKLVIYIDTALPLEDAWNYLNEFLDMETYELRYTTGYTYILEAG